MKAAAAIASLLLVAPRPEIQIVSPLPGWTSAETAELVASVPGADLPRLDWLGAAWELSPSAAGRVSLWLPLVPGWNELSLSSGAAGARRAAPARVRLWRELAPGESEDLLIVAGWAPGAARLDLRVTDPSGEGCDSSNRRTRLGGLRVRDDPEAPGPHVFVLPRAAAGEYHVSLLCGRLAPGAFVPVHAFAVLFPGTPREERFDLSGVVGRCDIETDLGTVEVIGRLQGAR
ncbi:MAG: hypothetical protein ACYDCL_17340 [Myxococcales bacterium]